MSKNKTIDDEIEEIVFDVVNESYANGITRDNSTQKYLVPNATKEIRALISQEVEGIIGEDEESEIMESMIATELINRDKYYRNDLRQQQRKRARERGLIE